MLNTIWGVIRGGRIEPTEALTLEEGARVLITLIPDEETDFWLAASESSLAAIWDNPQDDVYAELLKT